MQITNTVNSYGLVTKLLHWIMAILLIGLLALGLYMVSIPISYQKLKLYGWHKEYGLLALGLVIVRVIWRLLNAVPELSIPWWEKLAARIVHWAFYFLMFAMPLTGWLVTSAAGLPASFFGWFVLPDLVAPNQDLLDVFEELHEWLGYGLIAVIVLHTSAALKHHFINKDNILRRML
ncbi:MAG: cytochrome b [Gammaproteobacteria bacterium]